MMPDHFHQYIQTRSDGSLYLPMWKAFFSIFINHFPKLDNPRFKGCGVRQIGSKLYPVDNIIAHTAKRDRRSPISSDDLQGNKRFFDFIDSCFAIGQSFKDKNIQYVKQLKCRVGEFSHAADNVILIRKVKDGAFLHFETIGFDNEEALLPPKYSSNSDWLLEMVLKLHSQNLPERQIAQQLGISKSKVHRLLVSFADSNTDQPISLAK